ncbi:MAG: AbrB/MazE/SpoVT family DNA-binding domain-containing protein [Pirellulales bacterium]
MILLDSSVVIDLFRAQDDRRQAPRAVVPGEEVDFAPVSRYLTYMTTKVSSKGQIVLPAEVRELDRIRPGHQFSIERLSAGEYLLKKIPVSAKAGLTDWLLACPEKGWFQAIGSESTDTL